MCVELCAYGTVVLPVWKSDALNVNNNFQHKNIAKLNDNIDLRLTILMFFHLSVKSRLGMATGEVEIM
jgi:hypothetical protein